jgi:hypothetical protein
VDGVFDDRLVKVKEDFDAESEPPVQKKEFFYLISPFTPIVIFSE